MRTHFEKNMIKNRFEAENDDFATRLKQLHRNCQWRHKKINTNKQRINMEYTMMQLHMGKLKYYVKHIFRNLLPKQMRKSLYWHKPMLRHRGITQETNINKISQKRIVQQ